MSAESFKVVRISKHTPILFKVSEPNFKNLVILKIEECIDDWEEIYQVKDLKLWVAGENLKEIEKNIDEYLDEKTLDYNILSQNITRDAYKHLCC